MSGPTKLQIRMWESLPGYGDLQRKAQFRGSKKECLAEIRRVADLLGRVPSAKLFNEHGTLCVKTVQNLFGSWNAALAKAKLSLNNRRDVTPELCIKELRRVAKKIGKTPTTKVFRRHSNICAASVEHKFGTWTKALLAAGLKPTKNTAVSKVDIVKEIQRMSRVLGHPCSSMEFQQGRFGIQTAVRRFGSWLGALQAAGMQPSKYQKWSRVH